ncbi:hypothetical protein BDK51DRAFT_38816 [Blyttiomyces helicus]|uniref:Uncharacterized protein n=1 Tax=Blyttiomyces helicus TaxID=388810 RepID=A0A4V1IQT3_9FUNG|nr:hypothetical protein BDK51DRAFT_38816 [Blyttiomyces helicus]|eukprot:RKO87657.1 hypothetical protein BDK51DRAFT_38816 [Blyttiomyces helicus]
MTTVGPHSFLLTTLKQHLLDNDAISDSHLSLNCTLFCCETHSNRVMSLHQIGDGQTSVQGVSFAQNVIHTYAQRAIIARRHGRLCTDFYHPLPIFPIVNSTFNNGTATDATDTTTTADSTTATFFNTITLFTTLVDTSTTTTIAITTKATRTTSAAHTTTAPTIKDVHITTIKSSANATPSNVAYTAAHSMKVSVRPRQPPIDKILRDPVVTRLLYGQKGVAVQVTSGDFSLPIASALTTFSVHPAGVYFSWRFATSAVHTTTAPTIKDVHITTIDETGAIRRERMTVYSWSGSALNDCSLESLQPLHTPMLLRTARWLGVATTNLLFFPTNNQHRPYALRIAPATISLPPGLPSPAATIIADAPQLRRKQD